MRAAPLVKAGTFEPETRERPTPGPSEVLVEVSDVGICGSDVHWYEHGEMGDRVVEDPLVLGHESAGTVVEVGAEVDDHAVGDAVTIEPGVPCGECEHCRRGAYNLCRAVEFMATPGTDGAFREYVAWPAEYVYGLPASVSPREGALCEPISVGVHAVRRAEVGMGDSVLVMGAGPIGLLAADVARAAGAANVAVVDVVDSKLDRALDRGADLAIDSRETNPATAVRDEFGAGVDAAIEATGAPPAIEAVLDTPGPDGTAVLVGLAPDAEVPVDTFELVRRQVDVRGSYRFANTYPTAISLLASGDVDAAGIVDFDLPLDRIGDAFERATEPDVVKGMISTD
ncbi:L-iditol 2-dehydrogenase [Natronoarchaeum philippinense]|uniref:L-iditol 2-dehydrogenase n=1 Tax=Natronoarchaeum philippinense TaxID=558529 RepID=A0A285P6L6_NATPI|nr:NAD(P)-dependent alcohol dehydrogenase [Natronoarchaeum philippinense]SNZ15521.1 L-iditol 2-dehydrogenase [Natronoarchaeum philippinense]